MLPVLLQPLAPPFLVEVLVDLLLSEALGSVTCDHLISSHTSFRCAHPRNGPKGTVWLRAQLAIVACHYALIATLFLKDRCSSQLGKRLNQRRAQFALLSGEQEVKVESGRLPSAVEEEWRLLFLLH